MPEFNLTLHKAYYGQGFFNVPADIDRYVGPDEAKITLELDDGQHELIAKVNRRAQTNGTARIMGGAPLKRWFQDNFVPRDALMVEILSPTRMAIHRPSNPNPDRPPVREASPMREPSPARVSKPTGRAQKFTRLPVVSLGAEYLVAGHLMRRNILTFKAPPGNEGYDLICIHPDPRKAAMQLRVQVKSRFATDCDRGFLVNSRSFDAFDFLIVAFLNIGYFLQMAKRHPTREGERPPEFYTFTPEFIRAHHRKVGKWEKVITRNLDIEANKDSRGFDLIADALGIEYPAKIPSGA